MSERIGHLQAQIPLYINGALQDKERNAFEQALKQDFELKQECKEFHEIESVIDGIQDISDLHFDQLFARIQSNVRLPVPAHPPAAIAEEDSTVIMRRREDNTDKSGDHTNAKPAIKTPEQASPPKIGDEHSRAVSPEIDDRASITFKESLGDFFSSARLAWGVVIAQFALLITLWLSSTGNGITAIGTDGKPITNIATINVVFADHATQKEIRELLAGVDAQIANGPTSIGMYTIYIKGTDSDAKSVIDKLKKSTLILLAEPSFI